MMNPLLIMSEEGARNAKSLQVGLVQKVSLSRQEDF